MRLRLGGRSDPQLCPLAGKASAAQDDAHGNASARADFARRVNLGDCDIARDALVSNGHDVHRHTQRAICPAGDIERLGKELGRAAVGKDEDAKRKHLAEPAAKLFESARLSRVWSSARILCVLGVGKRPDRLAESESLGSAVFDLAATAQSLAEPSRPRTGRDDRGDSRLMLRESSKRKTAPGSGPVWRTSCTRVGLSSIRTKMPRAEARSATKALLRACGALAIRKIRTSNPTKPNASSSQKSLL